MHVSLCHFVERDMNGRTNPVTRIFTESYSWRSFDLIYNTTNIQGNAVNCPRLNLGGQDFPL